jgi:hypothetical protein
VYVLALNPVAVAVVCVLLQWYVYGDVPPPGAAVAEPLPLPLHKIFTGVTVAVMAVGCVNVTDLTVVHPLASVIVTVYVLALSPVAVAVVCALLQRYVYGDVPPPGAAVAVPLVLPLHNIFTCVTVAERTAGCVNVTVLTNVHPLASVIVTVYVLALSPVAVVVVCALLHKYVYGDVPPLGVTVAVPLLGPLHNISVCVVVAEIADGWVITTDFTEVQPFASVTVTV